MPQLQTLYFKVRMNGAVQAFAFETSQGDDIVAALQQYISNVMLLQSLEVNSVAGVCAMGCRHPSNIYSLLAFLCMQGSKAKTSRRSASR